MSPNGVQRSAVNITSGRNATETIQRFDNISDLGLCEYTRKKHQRLWVLKSRQGPKVIVHLKVTGLETYVHLIFQSASAWNIGHQHDFSLKFGRFEPPSPTFYVKCPGRYSPSITIATTEICALPLHLYSCPITPIYDRLVALQPDLPLIQVGKLYKVVNHWVLKNPSGSQWNWYIPPWHGTPTAGVSHPSVWCSRQGGPLIQWMEPPDKTLLICMACVGA